MTLEQRLTEDMKEAMRAKEELRLSVIRMLRGQILLEKKKGTGVTDVPDDTVIALVRGHAKRLREAIEQAKGAGRNDLAEQAEKELAIASAYLPAELSDEELDAIARAAVAESGATDVKAMGAVMKVAMPRVEGRADGKRVQEAVRRVLGAS
ncbi:MAG: GatB/YqeY domain-containing protein [Candidatus Eiseniibacteriota bacterium]